jgi:hypothetical protein
MDGPPELVARVRDLTASNVLMRRMWLYRQLEGIGIDPTSKAGLAVIDRYDPIDENGHVDSSVLHMKAWMTEEMGTDGY